MLKYRQFLNSFTKSGGASVVWSKRRFSTKPEDNTAWTFIDIVMKVGMVVPVTGIAVMIYDIFYLRPKLKQQHIENEKHFEEAWAEKSKKLAEERAQSLLKDQEEDALFEARSLARKLETEEMIRQMKEMAEKRRNERSEEKPSKHSIFPSHDEDDADDDIDEHLECGMRPSEK